MSVLCRLEQQSLAWSRHPRFDWSWIVNHVAIPSRWKEDFYHVGSSCTVNSILQAGLIAGGKDTEEWRQTVFFTPSDPTGDETEEEYDDLTKTTKSTVQDKRKNSLDAIHWVNEEKSTDKGLQSWQTRSHAITLNDSVPATSSENYVEECAWQVQHDIEVQQQSSTEPSCAEGDPSKVDLRVQGVTQNAVLEDQGRVTKIQDLVHTLRTQSRTESVIIDLKKTREFNTFSEESKRPSKAWERSNYVNWEKFLRKYSARRGPGIGLKDCFAALAENV